MQTEHLVLLPGMMCDERLWAAQRGGLRDRCASITVADITRADCMRALAGAVLASAPARFALAGLSMGGIVALEIWRQAPERVSRLALLDTTAYAETPERRALRDQMLGRVREGEFRQVLTEDLKPRYLARVNRDNRGLLNEISAMALDLGEAVFARQSRALKHRPDSTQTLATIHVPALILCGAEDALCPPEYHRLMAACVPNARLVVLDQCGHLSTMEQPGRVTAELRAWLRAA